jgi:hypothetical protein
MGTLYEITGDVLALKSLMDSLVDEDGNPREPTEEELAQLQAWAICSKDEFVKKIEGCCKYIKNLEIDAADCDAERKNRKDELDRLSKRSKAYENKAKSVKNLLWFGMERLKMKTCKTLLFNLNIQNTRKSVNPLVGYDWHKIPEELLKVEVDTGEVQKLMSAGRIITKDGDLNYGKLFWDSGKEIQGIKWAQGSALVIR